MKNKKIILVLIAFVLILIPASIAAVSTIIEKVKVVPDVPEPILQNVPEEAYIRTSNDILEEKTVSDPELEEKLKNAEEENKARNKKIEEIIRKFNASEYDALMAEVANGYTFVSDGYYSEDDLEIRGDKLVLNILENEKLTEEESNLLKELLLDDASNIKNMPDFVARIENACK
jgi:hypothetical protein